MSPRHAPALFVAAARVDSTATHTSGLAPCSESGSIASPEDLFTGTTATDEVLDAADEAWWDALRVDPNCTDILDQWQQCVRCWVAVLLFVVCSQWTGQVCKAVPRCLLRMPTGGLVLIPATTHTTQQPGTAPVSVQPGRALSLCGGYACDPSRCACSRA